MSISDSSSPSPAPSPLEIWPPVWAPTAVVFDCDGLLVDTEGQWIRMQDAYLHRHGTGFTTAQRREITGRSAEVVLSAIAEKVGKAPETVYDELFAEHRDSLDAEMVPMPGAMETLRAVAAVRPVAVASNSPREMLDVKLAGLGIMDLISASFAIEDVAEPKPAPDLYTAAARALGAAPGECLCFEDSETGAEAALSAGLQLIAVPSIPGQEPQAPRRLNSLEDPVLHAWIASWG